jgi:hypothetical protein
MGQLHSWYKHLPLAPSVPFRFLIGPDAPLSSEYGARLMDWRYVGVRSASDHSESYGHWTCLAPFEMYQGLSREHVAEVEAARDIWVLDGEQQLPVPEQILAAGTVRVNALVDPRTSRVPEDYWLNDPQYGAAAYLAELGVTPQSAAALPDAFREHITRAHIAAVRERTLAAMTAAMRRVTALIWDGAPPL